ncbi:MAG: Ribosome recycling factor, partial [Bacteroidota bacterium]
GVSEDAMKEGEDRIQTMTNSYISKVESTFADKEKDIMSV